MNALDMYVPGQRVRAYWTNSNRDYEADGVITRVNAKTVRVNIDGATVLKTGVEWVDGKLKPFLREPAPRADWNTVIPVPGTTLNRVEAIEAATPEELETAKDTERERLQRKADRFSGFAENAEKSADAAFSGAKAATEHIPFGQPILVDHYSARGHRRAVQRNHELTAKGFAESERAGKWFGRVAGIKREMKRKGL